MNQILDDYAALAKRERLLPVRVTAVYKQLVDLEVRSLGHSEGPLFRVAFPTSERLSARAPGEVADFVDDRSNMPETAPGVIRKYRDRLLFLVTERCAGHCMYCFRQDVLADPTISEESLDIKVDALVAYLKREPEVKEVIFSGGDPLNVGLEGLRKTILQIRAQTCVRSFRVHTRNVVFAPQSLTDKMCAFFAEHDVRLVVHAVHPYELHDTARNALARATNAGVRCFAQFPILRGINDHPQVLIQLLRLLDELRVRPLTMFVPDPINYSATFRLRLRRLLDIVREIHLSTPAWISAVRVVLDTSIGKVRPQDIVEWREREDMIVFERDGQRVRYTDLPVALDKPGNLETMLWKP